MLGLFKNKNTKRGGYTFTPERETEFKKRREFLLDEYDYFNCSNSWKKTKKRVIRVVDGFSDIGEVLSFYKIKPENCVAILGYKGQYSGYLNEIPKFPNNIAGVFCIHEKNRKISFPDGISENTVLYNVEITDCNVDLTKQYNLFSNIPTKEKLIKTIFGKEQRTKNQKLENFILSLGVVKKNDLYFYFALRSSEKVRKTILHFKDEYFKLKEKCMKSGKYYPRVPDEVMGGVFDWDQAEKDQKDGVKTKFFHGYLVYEELTKKNTELEYLLNLEKERIKFISQFPDLEEKLFSNAFNNEFGDLAKYGYSSYDRGSYSGNSDFNIRGLNDKDRSSIWSDLLTELEEIFEGKIPEKYCGSVDEAKKTKTKTKNEVFEKIIKVLISGKASKDEEKISYVNLRSTKSFLEQIERGTTFTFVDMPFIETENYLLKGMLYKSVHDFFKSVANEELEKGFIKSSNFETI